MKKQKARIVLAMTAASLLLTGCEKVPVQNIGGVRAPIIKPAEAIIEVTPTPEPVIVKKEVVKSRSPLKIEDEAPHDVSVPAYYQVLDITGVPYVVYAYTSTDATTKYRVYATVNELEDGEVVKELAGFFDAQLIADKEKGIRIEVNKENNPVAADGETPAEVKVCDVPTKNNIRAAINGRKRAETDYQKAVRRAEKDGSPAPEKPQEEDVPRLDESTTPIKIPDRFRRVGRKYPNLYYYENVYGDKEYRQYGTPNGSIGGFFMANEEGSVSPGALMINYEKDVTKERFKARKPIDRPEDGIYRNPVFIYSSNGVWLTAEIVFHRDAPI